MGPLGYIGVKRCGKLPAHIVSKQSAEATILHRALPLLRVLVLVLVPGTMPRPASSKLLWFMVWRLEFWGFGVGLALSV